MSKPIRLELSDEQRTFYRAVCERLGIDPAIVHDRSFCVEVFGGEDLGKVELTAYLPADELLRLMFDAGLRPSRSA